MRRHKGVTLIEMVLTLVLLTIVSLLLMVSLKNPLDALTYFKQSFAAVEPIVWVDQALKKTLRESKKVWVDSEQSKSTLNLMQEDGLVYAFECDSNTRTLVQRASLKGQVFEGVLLTQMNCQFTEQGLNQGKQIHLALELKSFEKAASFNRFYYHHE